MIKTLQNNFITVLVILSIISAIYLVSQDLLELAHSKNTLHVLQQTQITKENLLTKQLEKSKSSQLLPKQLNPSETLITFAKFCESSHLLLKKLQIKKLKSKSEGLMEVSLKSCGDYGSVINFLNPLNSLPYLVDFKNFKISKTRLQKPLEVNIELLLSTSYFPTVPVILKSTFCSAVIPRSAFCDEGSPCSRKISRSVAPRDDRNAQDDIASPFLIKRYTGKIEIPAHIAGNKHIPSQSLQLLSIEDEVLGTCILQKKLEYSPSVE